MFNDKITKKIVESAKKVLEAKKDEVPPVVMGRLPDVEFKKSEGLGKNKKMPETSIDSKKIPTKNLPLVQTGPGGEYVKRVMPGDLKTINLKKAVSGAINRLRGK
tara:strand:+ start:196 stop:510 length:315 start_codon:yes stop_codon:yes gene_type:complete